MDPPKVDSNCLLVSAASTDSAECLILAAVQEIPKPERVVGLGDITGRILADDRACSGVSGIEDLQIVQSRNDSQFVLSHFHLRISRDILFHGFFRMFAPSHRL